MSKKKKKELGVPAVVTGNSDKAKSEQFQKYAHEAARSEIKECGKGCRWRTLNTPEYQKNFEEIFGKSKLNCKEDKEPKDNQ